MTVVRKSITFTKQQDAWIKQQIEKGDFTNDSEYIRDLVRKDQARYRQRNLIDAQLWEGMASGLSDKSVEDIWNKAEVNMP